ncbi:Integral membrane protein [Frankia sp. AgKG'84/4]
MPVVGLVAAIVLAAGLAIGGAALGRWALAGVLVVEQGALAWAWGRSLHASSGTTALVAVAAALADLAVLVSHRHAYGSTAGVIGAAVAAVVLYQLGLRRALTLRTPVTAARPAVAPAASAVAGTPAAAASPASATRVSAEMITALSGVILGVLLTGYLAVRTEDGAPNPTDLMAIAGLLGAGVAVLLARLLGWAGLAAPAATAVGVLVGAGAGAVLGVAAHDGLSLRAGLVAAAAGAVVAGPVDLVLVRARATAASIAFPGVAVDLLLAAILPLACAAPLVYVVGRHLPA